MDIWVLRHAGHVAFGYHGLNITIHCSIGEQLQAARSIWFVDGGYNER